MKNKLKKKQHYKRKGKDPRRTQRGGGAKPGSISAFYDTRCNNDREFANVVLVTFTCITALTSENPFLHRNRGVNQHN